MLAQQQSGMKRTTENVVIDQVDCSVDLEGVALYE